ncbi:MAG: FAD-binding oxidoreductase [Actinomycetia bacterium]|nr:FAD-binding oxidoreductase [Actinomycetes bacterium]MCH9800027.1 FAD-binding oxidoreductase [Actinomycetes bacterium]
MSALLAPDYTESCLWQQQVTPPATPTGEVPAEVDVVVVGAGYCGLSAADTLAQFGKSVLVLDREPLGWGASSRNCGMVLPELKAGPAELARQYGNVGPLLLQEVEQGFDHIEALVSGADGRGGIDCDYRRSGSLYLAHSPRHVAGLRAEATNRAAAGENVRFLTAAELGQEVGSELFHGGLLRERGGAVHPAKLHAGLAARALASGAVIQDRTAAESIGRRLGRFTVRTTRGMVTATDVILATNGYADRATPELARRVLPIGSYIIATEVLPDDVQRSLAPGNRMMFDTKNFLYYWRLTPDGRLAFGGRRSLDPVEVVVARDFLYDAMLQVHPQLTGTPIEYAWGGNIAATVDRMPHVGRIDGAWYATGCNGSGVATNTWLGHQLGMTVAGAASPPAFAQLQHRALPLKSLSPAYLPLVGRWFARQDHR